MKIKITFTADLRTFKAGDTFEFDFTDRPVIIMTGKNGCGKSTLMNAIRSFRCDNEEAPHSHKELVDLSGSHSLNYVDLSMQISPFVKVEADFEKIYHLSRDFDDPMSAQNSYDALSFIKMGGFASQHKSTGQRSIGQLNKLLLKIKDKIDSQTLLCLDEADTGLDLANQGKCFALIKAFCAKKGCCCLMVTHSAIPFALDYDVYDLEKRAFKKGKAYFDAVLLMAQ